MTPQRATRSMSKVLHTNLESPSNQKKELEKSPLPLQPILATRKRKASSEITSVETSSQIKTIIPPKTRATRKQPARKVLEQDGYLKIEPPEGWEKLYFGMKAMREKIIAPVDSMGCDRLAEDSRPPPIRRFQVLITLMLSSQTKDTTTVVAVRDLQSLPGGLTLDTILQINSEEFNRIIGKVGFHNIKTVNIKKTAQILRDKFNGDIPTDIPGLLSLPGVGPKMAYLCMDIAWGQNKGIGVDVHVHRITNLWQYHKTSTPEETRKSLESWLPKKYWSEINWLLVGFGQKICLPVGRKCNECDLGIQRLCPSAGITVKRTTKVTKKAKIDIEIED